MRIMKDTPMHVISITQGKTLITNYANYSVNTIFLRDINKKDVRCAHFSSYHRKRAP